MNRFVQGFNGLSDDRELSCFRSMLDVYLPEAVCVGCNAHLLVLFVPGKSGIQIFLQSVPNVYVD